MCCLEGPETKSIHRLEQQYRGGERVGRKGGGLKLIPTAQEDTAYVNNHFHFWGGATFLGTRRQDVAFLGIRRQEVDTKEEALPTPCLRAPSTTLYWQNLVRFQQEKQSRKAFAVLATKAWSRVHSSINKMLVSQREHIPVPPRWNTNSQQRTTQTTSILYTTHLLFSHSIARSQVQWSRA